MKPLTLQIFKPTSDTSSKKFSENHTFANKTIFRNEIDYTEQKIYTYTSIRNSFIDKNAVEFYWKRRELFNQRLLLYSPD